MKAHSASKTLFGYDTRSLRSALIMASVDALPFRREPKAFTWGKSAVVSSLAGLGDFFIHLPLIDGIVEGNRQAGINTRVALRPSMLELGRLLGWDVFPFDNALAEFFKAPARVPVFQMAKNLRRARATAPEIWVDLSGNAVNALLVKLAGAKRLAMRITRGGRSLASHALPHVIGENEYANRERVAAFLGRSVNLSAFEALAGLSPERDSIVLGVTTACRWRNWPLANFLALTQAFPSRRFALIGFQREIVPDEQASLQELRNQPNVTDFLDHLSMIEMIRLISAAPAVVTNDTSCAHIANAFQRPGAVLFGPENSNLFSDPNGLRLFHDQSCPYYPCVQWVCRNPKRWCMKLISPVGVIAHLGECLPPPASLSH